MLVYVYKNICVCVGVFRFVCAVVRPPLWFSRCKMEPAAGRAGRAVPKPPAMTLVVGARFTWVVHRGWGRSIVRPLASALMFCYVQDMTQLRFALCCFFKFSFVFHFVHSLQLVGHSLALENKRASTINISHIFQVFILFYFQNSIFAQLKLGPTWRPKNIFKLEYLNIEYFPLPNSNI